MFRKPNWRTSGHMSVVLEPPPETMAVFTHCPNNLFLHKNLAVHRPCKGSVGPLSQSTWTCVRNLPYLLFGTEFFIAILEQKLHIYKHFIYKTLKQPWLVSFSFIKSPGKWLKCSATFTKRERRNMATLPQTLQTHHVFSYLHFRIIIGINQVMIFIMWAWGMAMYKAVQQ